jgi:hypothetical protein
MLPHENARLFRLSDARAESIFSFLARLQIPNVFYNFIDLRIAEHRTEGRHCARLARQHKNEQKKGLKERLPQDACFLSS